MEPIKCSSCGATLPDIRPGSQGSCTFCGSPYLISRETPQLASQPPLQVSTRGCAGVSLVILIVLIVFVASGVGLFLSLQTQDPSAPSTESVSRPDERVPLSELSRTQRTGWFAIQVNDLVGGFSAFEPMANLEVMHRVAQSWSADAVLRQASFQGVRPDGTMDLTSRDDWYARFNFTSPALRASAMQAAQVTETEVRSELQIKISEGEVTVLIHAVTGHSLDLETPPPLRATCSPQRVLELLSAEHGLPPRPVYDLDLSHSVRYGWFWGVDDVPRDGNHRVRAEDCTVL